MKEFPGASSRAGRAAAGDRLPNMRRRVVVRQHSLQEYVADCGRWNKRHLAALPGASLGKRCSMCFACFPPRDHLWSLCDAGRALHHQALRMHRDWGNTRSRGAQVPVMVLVPVLYLPSWSLVLAHVAAAAQRCRAPPLQPIHYGCVKQCFSCETGRGASPPIFGLVSLVLGTVVFDTEAAY